MPTDNAASQHASPTCAPRAPGENIDTPPQIAAMIEFLILGAPPDCLSCA
jgi:hypothetical protein